MTINVENSESIYIPTLTATGPFDTIFTYHQPGDVAVIIETGGVEDEPLQLAIDYTLAGTDPLHVGGQVTLTIGALPVGGWDPARHRLILRRVTPLDQPSVFGAAQTLRTQEVEYALDRLTRQTQDLQRELRRLEYQVAHSGGGGGGGGGATGALLASNNLSELSSKAISRQNLGLGSAATRNVGATAGTVAAGDDPRFSSTAGAGLVDVNDYLLTDSGGNVTDTNYDGAFARALAAKAMVYVPPKPKLAVPGVLGYAISQPIVITDGQVLKGAGSKAVIISCTTANQPVVKILGGIYGARIEGFTATHSVIPTAGGDGIQQGSAATDWCDQFYAVDVRAYGNYRNWNMGRAFFGAISFCNATSSIHDNWSFISDGVSSVAGVPQSAPLQWYLTSCSEGMAGRDGYHWESIATGANLSKGISVGTMTACTGYAPTRYGAAFIGTDAGPIYSPRLKGGFFGEGGDHSIYLDTHGNGAVIDLEMVELSGFKAGGSSSACGVYVTGNGPDAEHRNTATRIAIGQVKGNKGDGVFIGGPRCQVMGGFYINNGAGGVATRRNGVNFYGYAGSVIGITAYDTSGVGAGSYQQYGVASNTDGMLLSGCDLTGNGVSPMALATIVNTVIAGCLPAGINTLAGGTIPGNVTITGNLTVGGSATATTDLISLGTLHVSGQSAFADHINLPGAGTTIYANNGSFAGKYLSISNSAIIGPGGVSSVAGQLEVTNGILLTGATGGFQAGSVNVPTGFKVNNTAVGGAGTLTGDVTITGNLTVGGSVTATTDLISLATLHVAGQSAFADHLNVTGAGTTIYNNNGSFAGKYLAVSNSAAIGSVGVGTQVGRLDVSGGVVVGAPTGGYSVGVVNVPTGFQINGASFGGNNFTGNVTITGGSLSVGGQVIATSAGALQSSAGLALAGAVTGATNITLSGSLTAGGSVYAGANMQAASDLISLGTLHVYGQSAFSDHLNVTGAGTTIYNNNGSFAAKYLAVSNSAVIGSGGVSSVPGRLDVGSSIYVGGTALNVP